MPGLQVQVQGTYNAQNQLVANTVKFNSKSLQTATDSGRGNPSRAADAAAASRN